MKTIKLLLTILLFSWSLSFSQSISVSPYSIAVWGKTPHMGSVGIEYKDIGIHYFHAYQSRWLATMEYGVIVADGGYTQSTFALSWKPLDIANIFKTGILVSANRFPTEKSNYTNFILDLGYTFSNFRLSYVHVSNGFGLFNEVNPGLDRIKITIPL